MSIAIYAPPYGDVVSVEEMKNHLKADVDITEDDALIAAQITTARELIETATGANLMRCKTMLATTFDLALDIFPWPHICLPRVPLISVSSISYVDTGGNTQVLSTSLYVPDYVAGKIDHAYNQIWPSTLSQPNAVTVRFVAGMAAVVTAVAASDVLTVYGRTYADGDRLQLTNSGGTLPGGLLPRTTYFVVSSTGSTFKLSLTSGGTAIDITSPGAGVHYASLDIAGFIALRQAVLLRVGSYYRRRGDDGFEGQGTLDTTQRAIDSLVASGAA